MLSFSERFVILDVLYICIVFPNYFCSYCAQGQMALRTRCLECERFTERREDYLDISVAVRQPQADKEEEDDGDEEEGQCF